jgi:hypothetical protein
MKMKGDVLLEGSLQRQSKKDIEITIMLCLFS